MVGHIAGLGYSQRMSATGLPLNGCKLYVYVTGTSTPTTTYTDYGLTTAHPFPIVADAAGIIPMFWVADGTYRVRLTDADGNEIFDDDGIVALGASSGSAVASSSVDGNAIFDSGDFLWQPKTGTRTGWVRANARTIGSAASGATERANSDVEDLFNFLWNNFSNTLCAVSGGRGGSSAADWAANKTITTPDMRGRGAFGLDDMGNTVASRLAAGTPTAISASGAETTSVTVAQANLPNVTFAVTGWASTHNHADTIAVTSAAAHTHGSGTYAVTDPNISNGTTVAGTSHISIVRQVTVDTDTNFTRSGGADGTVDVDFNTTVLELFNPAVGGISSTGGSHTHTLTGSVTAASSIAVAGGAASGGSGTALAINKMPPYYLGTWYIKI